MQHNPPTQPDKNWGPRRLWVCPATGGEAGGEVGNTVYKSTSYTVDKRILGVFHKQKMTNLFTALRLNGRQLDGRHYLVIRVLHHVRDDRRHPALAVHLLATMAMAHTRTTPTQH